MLAVSLVALLATSVLAAPRSRSAQIRCDVSHVDIPLPPDQSQLVNPTTSSPSFIGVGLGVQNYTCGSTGTYTNVGALAELFDISCLYSPGVFNEATNLAFDAWENAPAKLTTKEVIDTLALFNDSSVLGQHYFITNPVTGSGLSPKWDFTSASLHGQPEAFVVGAKVGDLPDPNGDSAVNIDWLELNAVQGELASTVFRIQTRGGQPPTSCTPGSPEIFVRYVAQYWLYGGDFSP